ncbi:MAG TPA: electron transfer flavoprotein subunit beta/FixA family protein [Saprospiraceae bacterium]|nr:electron transfer flavoprotein subunit beta/FixA family protein [Saprospiraceae bacterium]
MKLLVAISQTPETTARIAFKNEGTTFDNSGVNFIINPYDEWYALVRALELKEQKGGTVTVIHCGPAANEVNIRKALAIGADEAIRIDHEPDSSISVATQISNYAKDKNFDIILTGKETIDFNGSSVGAMIGEFLDLPFISLASKLDFNGDTAIVTRDIEGGVEEIEVNGPFVLSAAKGLAEQRIPNMRGIMSAKTKPLQVIAPVPVEKLSEYVQFKVPASKSSVKMVAPDNMDELVRLLHEEAKVI